MLIELRHELQEDFYQKIRDHIVDCCNNMVDDYAKSEKKIPKNDENIVRNILVAEYLQVRELKGVRFDLENAENYDPETHHYKGRTDIRALLETDFSKHDAYFTIECKRLDGNNKLNLEYVKNGVRRFVTRKYSSYYGISMMLGFIVEYCQTESLVEDIERIQDNDDDCRASYEYLGKNQNVSEYGTVHLDGKLKLRHLFFNIAFIV